MSILTGISLLIIGMLLWFCWFMALVSNVTHVSLADATFRLCEAEILKYCRLLLLLVISLSVPTITPNSPATRKYRNDYFSDCF